MLSIWNIYRTTANKAPAELTLGTPPHIYPSSPTDVALRHHTMYPLYVA